MKKKDLKSGMVVEYRNGQLRMIVGSKLFDKDGNRMYELKNYDEYLCCGIKNYDIIAVYTDFDKTITLWKRPNRKQEIINQLMSIRYNSESNIDDEDEDDIWKKDVEVLNEVIDFIEKFYRD